MSSKSRLVCVVGEDYGVVLWAYGDAAAAMDEAYGWDLFDWPTGTLPPDGMRNRVVTWEGLLDHDDDDRPYMEGEWRESTYEELLSLSPIHRTQAHIPRYDKAPNGWRFDRTWTSAVTGYVPVCDGVSPLHGGKKGLLRLTPEIADRHLKWRLSGCISRFSEISGVRAEEGSSNGP